MSWKHWFTVRKAILNKRLSQSDKLKRSVPYNANRLDHHRSRARDCGSNWLSGHEAQKENFVTPNPACAQQRERPDKFRVSWIKF